MTDAIPRIRVYTSDVVQTVISTYAHRIQWVLEKWLS